jgi:hypothetical protein
MRVSATFVRVIYGFKYLIVRVVRVFARSVVPFGFSFLNATGREPRFPQPAKVGRSHVLISRESKGIGRRNYFRRVFKNKMSKSGKYGVSPCFFFLCGDHVERMFVSRRPRRTIYGVIFPDGWGACQDWGSNKNCLSEGLAAAVSGELSLKIFAVAEVDDDVTDGED